MSGTTTICGWALAEKLDPEEDYRPLLDRAYEIGYKPEWDGSVELNNDITVGDMSFGGIIDVENALDAETALSLGYISPEDYQLGLAADDATEEVNEEGFVEPELRSSSWSYTWTKFNGSNGIQHVRSFRSTATHRLSGHYPGTRHVNLSFMPTSLIARTYYRRGATGSNPSGLHWSTWRRGQRTGRSRRYTFSSIVYGRIAQITRG